MKKAHVTSATNSLLDDCAYGVGIRLQYVVNWNEMQLGEKFHFLWKIC